MVSYLRRTVLIALTAILFSSSPTRLAGVARIASPVEAVFDLEVPTGSPFPSDRFTVSDASQNTGLRVNLPKPDCAILAFDCVEIDLLNELDGFHIQPRMSIPFSGPIDMSTVSSGTVFLVQLGDPVAIIDDDADRDNNPRIIGKIVGINQVVWDVATNSLHATADEILEQHTRYALIVTRGVKDEGGNPVEPSAAFERCRHDLNFGQTHDSVLKAYRKELLDAFTRVEAAGIDRRDIVVATVFTTQSVTASLVKIHDQVNKAPTPEAASFDLPVDLDSQLTVRAVFKLADFNLSDVNAVTGKNQVRDPLTNPATDYTSFAAAPRLSALGGVPGAVAIFAAGRYKSPNYAVDGVIPPFGTRTGTPEARGTSDVFFTLFLPSGDRPSNGWPVVIYGPGQPGDDMWTTPFNIAARLAAQGLATVSIQSAWHGFGPNSKVTVKRKDGSSITFLAGGRNFDRNHDGTIDATEGVVPYPYASTPFGQPPDGHTILGSRDAWRQTIADTMQFVRVIGQTGGVDVDGDGVSDLDASHIDYVGFSGGTWRGVPFVAVEPNVRAAVFHGGGAEEGRLSPAGNRSFVGTLLAAHGPSLINPDGAPLVTSVGGISVAPPFFNENLPLRDEPEAVSNSVPGAIDIQRWLERKAWLGASADSVAFAPYLRKHPITEAGARPVLVLFARGDQTVPNPATTALLRAGDLMDRATFFRNDRAVALSCNAALPPSQALEKNPHSFLVRLNAPLRTSFAVAAQAQVATFLSSMENDIIDPDSLLALPASCSLPANDGADFFEVGRRGAPLLLREELGYIP
jgi:hypothetical protein